MRPFPAFRRLAGPILPAVLFALLAACAPERAGDAGASAQLAPARYTMVANGETVGHLRAEADGDALRVDFHVDNNGRGPKHRETLRLSEAGGPLAWEIDGTSLMGGPVEERYRYEDGRASWYSQADSGETAAEAPPLYVVNDASPWALIVYERLLRAQPGQAIDVVPGGRLRREEVTALPGIGEGLSLVRIVGLDLAPEYLVLDRDGAAFAVLGSSGTAIREGEEDLAAALRAAVDDAETARNLALQRRLAARHEAGFAVRDVRLLDARAGALSAPATVVVRDGRIDAVLAADAPLDEALAVYEGEGGTLLPGLHDMHAHTSIETGWWYLAAGVTTIRDMGNDNRRLADLMWRIEAGELAGPRIVRNGFLEGRSPYSARNGVVADTLEEALQAVRDYARDGFWQIKIYNSMNPEWIPAIADEAHRLGLGVTGHVPAFATPDAMIEAGFDEIAHFNQLALGWVLEDGEDTRTPLRLTAMARLADLDLRSSPRVARTLALMRERGTALDTTAVILERLMLSRAGGGAADRALVSGMSPGGEHFLDHMPVSYRRFRYRTYVPELTPETDRAYHAALEKMIEAMALLHAHGIRLLPGTDDGTGFTVHREIELYARALGNAAALRAGTIGAAEYLGRADEYGTLAPGQAADFFLVPGDPLQDINAIRQVRLVSRAGQVYQPAAIYEALGVRPFVAAAVRVR
ncbi:amidohydrolase family protein [Luteimonas huabeiensis]|uniref:amidohydrolase family protein n=1 Tax=Luteimonas huabeiensis TaxID=1244513 RepID=UPI0004B2719F|nr:amidohydrolase family protein [Luteimonas huabeiensis]